MSKVKIFMKQP